MYIFTGKSSPEQQRKKLTNCNKPASNIETAKNRRTTNSLVIRFVIQLTDVSSISTLYSSPSFYFPSASCSVITPAITSSVLAAVLVALFVLVAVVPAVVALVAVMTVVAVLPLVASVFGVVVAILVVAVMALLLIIMALL